MIPRRGFLTSLLGGSVAKYEQPTGRTINTRRKIVRFEGLVSFDGSEEQIIQKPANGECPCCGTLAEFPKSCLTDEDVENMDPEELYNAKKAGAMRCGGHAVECDFCSNLFIVTVGGTV